MRARAGTRLDTGQGCSGHHCLQSTASSITALGAQLYFWARVAYVPLYAWGVRHLRSLAWLVSIVGLGMIAQAILLP